MKTISHHLGLSKSSLSGTVADGVEQPDVLPVAQHMGTESETGGELTDRLGRSVWLHVDIDSQDGR